MSDSEKTRNDTLLKLIEYEWKDQHHSRIQEWSALGVVTGAHVALTQLPKIFIDSGTATPSPSVIQAGLSCCIIFTIVGFLITCRHRYLHDKGRDWIKELTASLSFNSKQPQINFLHRPFPEVLVRPDMNGLKFPRRLSTGWMILVFYVLFLVADITCLYAIASRPQPSTLSTKISTSQTPATSPSKHQSFSSGEKRQNQAVPGESALDTRQK